ncbi:MAG: hypothetical protein L6290_12205 [Thermodesulfovibrionales bacterium]|nr:hypothetical protein [Thermodesulfovibrionales bacterium]
MNKITAGIDTFVNSLRIGEAQSYRNLTVYPLYSDLSGGNGYMLLDDALKTKKFVVTEVDETGHVPELKVINNLDLDVLILEGEELVGAKQNRIVNVSILVGKGRDIVVPVSCVEHGRWNYRRKAFRSGNSSLYAELRKKNVKAVHENLKQFSTYCADQNEIWNDIKEKKERLSVHSPTDAMNDIYKSNDKELRGYERAFCYNRDQTGFISMIDGKVIGCDIFGSGLVLQKVYKKILKSYILDALDSLLSGGKKPVEQEARVVDQRSKRFLENVRKAEREVFLTG